MGRPRTKNKHLPPGMRQKGAFYYFDTGSAGKAAFGKRRYLPLGNDFSAALTQYAELKGKPKADSKVLEMIFAYINHRLNLDRRRPRIGHKTAAEYRRLCGPQSKLALVFAELTMDDLEAADIDRFIDEHPHPITANRQVALLSGAWNYTKAKGLIASRDANNPCSGIKRNTENKRKVQWHVDQVALAREKATPQLRCIIDLALITSLRKRDLLRIRRADLAMPAAGRDGALECRISKARGKDKRLIFEFAEGDALHEILRRATKLRRRVSSLILFTTGKGQQYSESGFDSNWQRFIKKIGLRGLWFHDLRRTTINRARRAKGTEYARQLAGHESITTTERYLSDIEAPRVRVVE